MNKLSYFIILSLLSIALSCERGFSEEENNNSGNSSLKGTTLNVSPTDLRLGSGAGTAQISVTSDTEWSVFVNNGGDSVDGLSASPLSGKGNGKITVKYNAVKTQYYQQSAVIVFSYKSYGTNMNKTVSVYRKRLP